LVLAALASNDQPRPSPLLPLVGQKLAAAYPEEAMAMMSTCIVAAQAVMLPIA
jgi:hypothetical protein